MTFLGFFFLFLIFPTFMSFAGLENHNFKFPWYFQVFQDCGNLAGIIQLPLLHHFAIYAFWQLYDSHILYDVHDVHHCMMWYYMIRKACFSEQSLIAHHCAGVVLFTVKIRDSLKKKKKILVKSAFWCNDLHKPVNTYL